MQKTTFLTSRFTSQRLASVFGAVMLGAASVSSVQPASADTFLLNSGNSSAIFDSDVGFTNWTVDGVNQVFQTSNFIRVTGDTQELLVSPNPLSFTPNGANGGTIVFDSPSFNYTISLEFLLTGGILGSNQSTLTQTTTFINSSGAPINFSLFNYNDLDIAGNLDNDTATIDGSTFVATQTDGIFNLVSSLDKTPNLAQVGTDLPSALILDSLTDSSITNLNNILTSGAPLTDGRNFAYQFNVANLADNDTFDVTQTLTISAVPFEFSPAIGLGSLAILFGVDKLRKHLRK